MTTEETLEYNKRCAEFLGVTLHESQLTMPHDHFTCYHSDWNLIMEVVEDIETLGYQVNIQNNHCLIQKSESFGGSRVYAENKKEAAVQAINQFLIWYNENNK